MNDWAENLTHRDYTDFRLDIAEQKMSESYFIDGTDMMSSSLEPHCLAIQNRLEYLTQMYNRDWQFGHWLMWLLLRKDHWSVSCGDWHKKYNTWQEIINERIFTYGNTYQLRLWCAFYYVAVPMKEADALKSYRPDITRIFVEQESRLHYIPDSVSLTSVRQTQAIAQFQDHLKIGDTPTIKINETWKIML